MAALLQHFRYAIRTLRKAPLFSAVAVLSLALGIGANTAIFTLIHQLLLQPLPTRHPEQLVMLAGRGRHYGGNNGPNKLSYPMYQDIRDHNEVFSGMFCTRRTTVSLSFEGRTELVGAEIVSGNFFPVLGIGAAIGRVFTASDDLYQGAHPLAVLSYGFWKTRFAGDRDILGKTVVVNGRTLTIIGVSQAGFNGVEPGYAPQIRIPMTMNDDLPRSTWTPLNNRRFRFAQVFGRMKPGVTIEKAQAGLQPLFHQIIEREVREKEFAKASDFVRQEFLKMWMEVMPGSKGRSDLRRTYSTPLLALMVMVGLVLLIACSNLANLLIARASARQKEIAVRLALGAGRSRLIGQLLVESLLLSMVGGALGIALAMVIDQALIDFLPTGQTTLSLSSSPDWVVLGFTALVAALAGILFGLVPALQSTRPQLANTLKDQAGSVVQGGSVSLRKGLVVCQVALSLVLLIGAGLFLGTLRNLQGVNPGFNTRNLVEFEVEPALARFDIPWTRDYYRRLTDRLKLIPGVESSGMALVPLLQNNEWDNWMTIEGYAPKVGENPDPHVQWCSPGFFAAMGIPVLIGREFTAKDIAGAPKVAIVNQKFAKRYFGDASPVGRHVGMGIDPGTKMDIEIVAVAGDTKYEDLRQEIPYEFYMPYMQRDFADDLTVYARAHGDPTSAFTLLRKAVMDLDPSVPMHDLRTMDDQIQMSLYTERLLAMLSGVFGGLATVLAALGLYGVMAFTVARRTREIGIRMALGADGGSVVWMVMREVLTLASIGMAIGLATGWAATRLVKAQLFGVNPNDAMTMALAALGIATVAALSGYLPARRATRIDPVRALHWE